MPFRKSSKFYKTVLEKLQGDVIIIDRDFKYVYANPYAISNAEIREWIIGKTDVEYCAFWKKDPTIGIIREEKLKQALNSRLEVTWEEGLTDSQGNYTYFLRKIFPVIDDQSNEVLYFIGHGLNITERQKIRTQLEENKKLTDAILEGSPNSIFIKDAEGRFLLANKAVAELFNTTPDKLVNQYNIKLHRNNEESGKYIAHDLEVIKTKKIIRREDTFTTLDGRVIWFDTVKVPLIEADGTVNVLGISTDITERKLQENLLRESKKQLAEAQSLTKSGSWYMYLPDKRMEWSIGMFDILEKSSENTSPDFSEIIECTHPEDRERLELKLNTLIASGGEDLCEYRLELESGRKNIKCFNRAVVDESNKVIAILGSVIDVTEQIQSQKKLLLNEQRLNEAQFRAKMGSYDWDFVSGEMQYSNGAYKIYEWDEDEQIPKPEGFIEMIHPEDRNYFIELSSILPTRKEDFTAEIRVITKSGKLKYISAQNHLEFNEKGDLIRILGIILDITEQRVYETQLIKKEQRLNEAQELSKTGSFEYNMNTQEIIWSKGMYLIWELESTRVPTMEMFFQHAHPDDIPRIQAISDQIVIGQEPWSYNYRLYTGKKNLKYIEVFNKFSKSEETGDLLIVGSYLDVTESRKSEERLKQNEARLNEAQSLAKLGSFEYNEITGNIRWSEGMYSIFDLDRNVDLDLSLFFSLVHPDDVGKLIEHQKILNPSLEPWSHSVRLITAKNKLKYVDLFLKYSKSFEEGTDLIIGSCIDVTETKETEEKLKVNETRLLEAQQLSKSGSWEVNLFPDFSIDWSPGTYAIWDLNPEVDFPTIKNFYEHIAEEDRGKVRDSFDTLIQKGEPIDVHFNVITWANHHKIFYSRGKAIKDSSGRVIKMFGTNTDITEQHLLQERTKFSEQSLLQAQRIAKLGSFYFDLPSKTFDWAEGVYYIWERDPALKEPTFEEILEAIYPDDLNLFSRAIQSIANTGTKQIFEFRILLPSGSIKFIETRMRVGEYQDGRPVKLFGTLIDITERKNVEEELKNAKIIAEESSKAKELFLASISHELRTPLNGILGMSRLLKKSPLNSTQRDYTDVLHQTAENLLVIISDIIDFTRIEEGKLSLEEIDFDPKRVADTVINLQMFRAEEKDLILRHKHIGAEPLPRVKGDPSRLSQIILNLLSNAIKFTNYGEVTLSHQVVESDEDYVSIQFTVEDTGIGIPLHLQDRIFESFTQIGSDGSKHSGIGLGLTISKNLVERQGGKIWVESKEDIGSSFHFVIRYKNADLYDEIGNSLPIDLQNLGLLDILLAEDNKVNMFITQAILNDWGFNVDVAENGKEALEMLAIKDYDLILIDIQMPIMDGLEATKQIRALKDVRKSRVPVIALTANTSRQAHRQFMTLGMNDWLVKPFSEEALYRKIAMHIRDKVQLSESMRKRKFPTRRKPIAVKDDVLYDLSLLKSDVLGNSTFLIKMLKIFINTIPHSVDKMMDYYQRNELDEMSRLAHKIKPTIDTAGIFVLKDCIRNLEKYNERKRSAIQIKSDLQLLHKVIHEVVISFESEITSLKNQDDASVS